MCLWVYRVEEAELVGIYKAWKSVEVAGLEWAQKSGKPVDLQVLAEVLDYPGGAPALHLLRRDAIFAHQELRSAFLYLIHKYARSLSASGVPEEDLVLVSCYTLLFLQIHFFHGNLFALISLSSDAHTFTCPL